MDETLISSDWMEGQRCPAQWLEAQPLLMESSSLLLSPLWEGQMLQIDIPFLLVEEGWEPDFFLEVG